MFARRTLGRYHQKGRVIRRLVSLHYTLDDMLAEADRRANLARTNIVVEHTNRCEINFFLSTLLTVAKRELLIPVLQATLTMHSFDSRHPSGWSQQCYTASEYFLTFAVVQ